MISKETMNETRIEEVCRGEEGSTISPPSRIQEPCYIKGWLLLKDSQFNPTMGSTNEINFINTPLLEENTEMETPSDQAAWKEVYNEEIDLSLSLLQVQESNIYSILYGWTF